MIEAYVSGLAFDTLSNAPVILLQECNGKRILPIWIGPNEAGAIALELSGIAYRRPLTHDLLKSIMNGFNAVLQKIVVSSLQENTFFAKFYIQASENEIIEIDARPSDSIAMALKMKAPIYISEELGDSMIELSQENEASDDDDSTSPTDLKKRLRNINPEDFGDFNL
jgi:hypothetical protein